MPDVREKLVELMKEAKYSVFPNSTDCYTFGVQHNDHIFRQVADHLIAHGVTVQEWIPVEERLPENRQVVIVCDIRENWIGCWEYRYGGEWADNYLTFSNSDITHWMPLPEPPKEDEDD